MIKKVLLSVLTVLVLSMLGAYVYFKDAFKAPINVCSVKGEAKEVPIHWSKSQSSDRQAMFIPVNIPGIPDKVFMQFDLGAVYSVLYSKPIQSLIDHYQDWEFKDGKEFTFHIMGMEVNYDSIKLFNYGRPIDFSDKKQKIIIGTIGTDMLERTKAVIDFQNSILAFGQHPSEAIKNRMLSNFEFKERRIMIPTIFQGESRTFMWDTGASAYDLITSEDNFHAWRDSSKELHFEEANQLNRKLKVYTAPASLHMKIGSKALDIASVTYVEGFPWYIKLMFGLSGMEGMIGNNVFKDQQIYLDCANGEFLIL